MKLFINPLQVWLWYGALIMIFGGIVVAIPVGRGARVYSSEVEKASQTV
jgi:ABC-type phosphate transport system permease subunit